MRPSTKTLTYYIPKLNYSPTSKTLIMYSLTRPVFQRAFLLTLLLFLSIASKGQIIFESGYFIDESDQRIDCLIKNVDWKDNPTEFKYKLNDSSAVKEASLQNVKEFGIDDGSKFVRARTLIDRSSDKVRKMSPVKEPEFKEEVLFLKVLIEGKASLFAYVDGNLTRFFYKMEADTQTTQLVYKAYLIDNTNIGYNNYFKQQLIMNLICSGVQFEDIEKLRYAQKDLEAIFISYNKCVNSEYTTYLDTPGRDDIFHMAVRAGVSLASLEIQNSSGNQRDNDFDNKLSFRLGVEAECILPFNKNKWSIVLEPTYQYYKAENTRETGRIVLGGNITTKVDYQSIELPLGLRYYVFLNNQSKLFVNVFYVADIPMNSFIGFTWDNGTPTSRLEMDSSGNGAFGLGYKYGKRMSVEVRYHTDREVLGNYRDWASSYNKVSLILGYSLF